MTFKQAQKIAREYEFLKGQKALTGETIVAIIIMAVGEADCTPFAFYYKEGGSMPGNDPVELYEDRK